MQGEFCLPFEEEANSLSFRLGSRCGVVVLKDSALKEMQDCHTRKAEREDPPDNENPAKSHSWETKQPLDLIVNVKEQREIRLGPEIDAARL